MAIAEFIAKRYYPTKIAKPEEWVEVFNNFYNEHLKNIIGTSSRIDTSRYTFLLHCKDGYRYFDFKRDFSKFFDEIKITEYHDIELSTKIIYDAHKEIMKEYDIRDKYELYHLIKRLKDEYGFDNISFSRTPMISFDEFNRYDYYYSLLDNNPKLTIKELAKTIEQELGVGSGVALNEAYFATQQYWDKKDVNLPGIDVKLLEQKLTDNVYYEEELSKIFNEINPEISFNSLSTQQLKMVGLYKNYNTDYYFHGCKTKEEYIEILLKNNNGILDLNKNSYKGLTGFYDYRAFYTLQQKGKCFSFAPKVFIGLERLEKLGITLDDIYSYSDSVYGFVDSSYFFSIKTLLKHGHQHKLYDTGFDDYFFARILMYNSHKPFAYQNVGSESYIFRKDGGLFTIKDLIFTLFGDNDSMPLEDMLKKMNENYDVAINNTYVLIDKIKDSGLYYDEIMNKIYKDEDAFLRDLEEDL